MVERAELEENYSKAMERISTSLAVYSDRGPLADVMNSLKSYHALKSEQSRIFGISLKDEVIQTLKEMLKKETLEARKFITKGKQNDLDMKLLVDKIETTKKKYININNETEEAQKTKAFLYNVESNDSNIEERRKMIFEKLDRLTNARFDCDIELKTNLEEYNKFKTTFTEQSNSVVDFFKSFDERRLDCFKDSIMKYFVYEISCFRNIQYDVNKLIQKVETADFSKEVSGSNFYRFKKEPDAIDFEKFKDTFINQVPEAKPKTTLKFDKTQLPQIPENLGNTFKSIVGFFTTPRGGDLKKREESKVLEKHWTSLSRGQILNETEEQELIKLLSQDAHRKLFAALFSKNEINLSEVSIENYDKIKEAILRVLQQFLTETWQNKEWESLKLYVSSIRTLRKDHEVKQKELNQEEQFKEDIYNYLDDNLSSMNIFNDQTLWRDFLSQNIKNKENQKNQDKNINLVKLRHEITYMKHFLKNKEQLNTVIRSVANEMEFFEGDILKLLDDIENNVNDTFSQSEKESTGKEEKLDDWMHKMEQKITEVEKVKRSSSSIFSKKTHSDSESPIQQLGGSKIKNPWLKHSNSDQTGSSPFSTEITETEETKVPSLENSSNDIRLNNTEISDSGLVSKETEEFNTNNMA